MEAVRNALQGAAGAPVERELDISAIPDGVYTGEGKGLKPGIKVEVTVEGGKITNIEVLAGEDTPEYFNQAKAQVPKRIIEEQSVQVDAASGATFSSKGIMDAVKSTAAIMGGDDMSLMKKVTKGIFKETRPSAWCWALAHTCRHHLAVNGLGMGLSTAASINCVKFCVSLLRKFIRIKIRIPAYICHYRHLCDRG